MVYIFQGMEMQTVQMRTGGNRPCLASKRYLLSNYSGVTLILGMWWQRCLHM